MRIHIIAVGQKPPVWVSQAYHEYSKRLPHECAVHLTEINTEKRHKNANIGRLVAAEGQRMLDAIPRSALAIALDENGRDWTTRQLAGYLNAWMLEGNDVALLIGGPDGLAPACLEKVRHTWSLSRLTLPHALVRVIVIEQLYRAWSLNANHPYHRD